MKIRVFPPTDIRYQTRIVSGREYHATPGAYLDVLSSDADDLGANHWTEVAPVGTTAERPANPHKGDRYLDTDHGGIVVFDGAAWRDPNTANAV